jgi:DNA-binding MarR family transcriptional regulator
MNLSSKNLKQQLDQVKELESQKTFQLARLSKILEHHGQSIVQGSGVNLTGYRMLMIISIFDEITLSDLSNIMLVDGAQISRAAKELVHKNYLEYRSVPGNQRKKYLAHTKAGSELFKLLKPRFNEREANISKLLRKEGIEEMWAGVDLISEFVTQELEAG